MILSRGQFNNVSFFANKHPFVLFFQNVYQGFIVKILNISSLKKKKNCPFRCERVIPCVQNDISTYLYQILLCNSLLNFFHMPVCSVEQNILIKYFLLFRLN